MKKKLLEASECFAAFIQLRLSLQSLLSFFVTSFFFTYLSVFRSKAFHPTTRVAAHYTKDRLIRSSQAKRNSIDCQSTSVKPFLSASSLPELSRWTRRTVCRWPRQRLELCPVIIFTNRTETALPGCPGKVARRAKRAQAANTSPSRVSCCPGREETRRTDLRYATLRTLALR